MHDEDVSKTTFQTCYYHYKFKVLSFGLMNVLKVFKDLMNHVFCHILMLFHYFPRQYIVYSAAQRESMDCSSNAKGPSTYAKFLKCKFWLAEVAFLGHNINAKRV